MKTDDCKIFIESISDEYGFNKNKWKRVKKYKKDDLSLRDFENSLGDRITVAQSNDNLSLFDFNIANVSISDKAMNYLDREHLLGALSQISLKNDEYKEVYPLSSSFEIKSGHIIIQELQFKDGFVSETMNTKIMFDTENQSMFYCEMHGISYLRMDLGGDWELPIIAFAYWSQSDQRIKGFFPCGAGNVYNIVTNTAYTEEDNISPNYDLAEQIGFNQLKQIIAKDYTQFEKKKIKIK